MEAEIHFGIHYVIEEGVSGLKPLLTKPFFRRSGFSRDLLRHREPAVRDFQSGFRRNRCAIEGRGSGWKPPTRSDRRCHRG